MYRRIGKRTLDISLVLLTSLAWGPVWLLAAIAIRLIDGAPVHFTQPRVGVGATTFSLVKLRTMRQVPGADVDRLTRTGPLLRRGSIDEIPQVVNILLGDMSLVGPRPLFVRYLPYYRPTEIRRHEVRPGITGLAQVRGRNTLLWDERLQLDVDYVDRCTLRLDLRLLYETLRQVLSRSDIHIVPGMHQPPLDVVRAEEDRS